MTREVRGTFDMLRVTAIQQIQSPGRLRRLTHNPPVNAAALVRGFHLANIDAARRLPFNAGQHRTWHQRISNSGLHWKEAG